MKKIKLFPAFFFALAVLLSCNEEKTFTENQEDIVTMTDDEINSVKRQDSDTTHTLCFSKGEFEGIKLFMHH